jgi:hypothetical protein
MKLALPYRARRGDADDLLVQVKNLASHVRDARPSVAAINIPVPDGLRLAKLLMTAEMGCP